MQRRILWCVGLACLLATSAWAQLASQTALVGTVTDSEGLAIPRAPIVAVNLGTNDTYEAITNEQGYYHIQFVRPGRYEVSLTMTGFIPSKTTGVEVATNQVVRTDIKLQVGNLAETVTVEAKAQVLDTDRPTVSATINQEAIVQLPLNGRNVWSLAATTPGVLGGLNSDIGLSFRGAGQREIQNNLSLDGINATANLLAATSMRPIADAVNEIQVQTGSTSAEYGAYLGVHVNVVTKSGTNDLHGSIFYFGQDESLDERGYFDNPALPKNPRESKQYGGVLDGPIVIPGLYNGRDKSFFMIAYEGVRGESIASPIATVPTALMRQGNFSEITTPIRDPFTKQPFPGNIIPPSMLDPTSLELLQYYPAPTGAGTANNYQGPSTASDNVDQVLARLDHNLGNKVRLSLRYNWHDSYASNPLNALLPVAAVTQPRNNKNWLLGYTHTLSPNLLNDFRIGYHKLSFDTLNQFAVSGPDDAGASLGIPGFDGDVRYGNPGLPSVNISNFTGTGAGGTNWYQFDTTFQVSNVISWTKRLARHPRPASTCGGSRRAGRPPTTPAAASTSRVTSRATRWPTSCSACRAPSSLPRTRSRATWAAGGTGSSSTTCGRRPATSPSTWGCAGSSTRPSRRTKASRRCSRRISRRSSRRPSPRRDSSSTRGTTRTSGHAWAPPIVSDRRPCCAPGSASTTTRTR